jgi:hypothetical protein
MLEEAKAFGAVTSLDLTAEQSRQLQALASARPDPAFADFVAQVTSRVPGMRVET